MHMQGASIAGFVGLLRHITIKALSALAGEYYFSDRRPFGPASMDSTTPPVPVLWTCYLGPMLSVSALGATVVGHTFMDECWLTVKGLATMATMEKDLGPLGIVFGARIPLVEAFTSTKAAILGLIRHSDREGRATTQAS